jgi:hypothetical protein
MSGGPDMAPTPPDVRSGPGNPCRSSIDDIIDLYKRDVDVSLIEERLKRSVEERLEDLMELQRFAEELRDAGREARRA